MNRKKGIGLVALLVLTSCQKDIGDDAVLTIADTPFALQVPPGFPAPVTPADIDHGFRAIGQGAFSSREFPAMEAFPVLHATFLSWPSAIQRV